jgi:hypothetical protein
MENLFQVLIFLFVLYTIFNTVFGKKKPQDKSGNIPQRNPEVQPQDSARKVKPSSDELLQELFGFKIPKTGGEYETLPQNKYPSNSETELPDIGNQPSVESAVIPDIDYDKLPSLELQQNVASSSDSHSAYEVKTNINPRTVELQRKIKNPTTLRELYLVSEILNKPKALRK